MKYRFKRSQQGKMKLDSGQEVEAPLRFDSETQAMRYCRTMKNRGGKDLVPSQNKDGSWGVKGRPLGERLQRWGDSPVFEKDKLDLPD